MGRHVGRDITIHGAALGREARRSHIERCSPNSVEAALVGFGQAAFAQPVGRDQGAMDDQVGIAADRRGEVGIARQREPKWPRFSGL